jgi:CheY-specific phosphatase CheX
METSPVSVLGKVFVRVLEDYAFLFGDLLQEGAPPPAPGPYLRVAMAFKGPFVGTLTMATPRDFGIQVAANVLGLEVDDPQTENAALDAVKELLNVTCGNLLTSLAGEEPVFDLTIPEVNAIVDAEWAAAPEAPNTVAFLVEEWPVFLNITIDGVEPSRQPS